MHRAPANCGSTTNGLKKIDTWLGEKPWDIIHFNFGIHDRNAPVSLYIQNLEQLVLRMKKSSSSLIWASSTPLPNVRGKYTSGSMKEKNSAAAELMNRYEIAINDLFTAISPRLEELQKPKDCHFTGEGNTYLGKTVATFLNPNWAVASIFRRGPVK